MTFKKQARAQYAKILAMLALLRPSPAAAKPGQIASLQAELQALAAALFGPAPKPAFAFA
jgi:hypothetical protein